METLVQQQYDKLAAIYDRRWKSYITRTLTFLEAWTQIEPQESVLDVACGTGEFERRVLKKNPDHIILGVDFSENMLALARKKCQDYRNVRFEAASATAIPAPAQAYDVVVCANAFHYFEQPEQALQEMGRVLKPEGRLVILDWCRDFWACQLCDWLLKLIDPAHQRCYTQAELNSMLESADFHIQQSRRIRFGLVWGLMVATAVPQVIMSQISVVYPTKEISR
ncbi:MULTISPECIES: methyltransferase domain-containing protein [unclassified Leptolyngbya]|uniref:class I SAM-dependent methyltransferase n=1 Tax=unclassified Leptolyngbya TaxID=2650499 RepID=UPI001683C670|nr:MULTISPECIES: methyltransferase domain-containing protein [unclassified Leptolyngbya]MBD1910013.1 methyltransferase domain-containing protein [Leptolyngbya sp. FACHB-8]MBD2156835.1 methyltransferase domain-containing protein [Leptolyngbya sp. FACHB-16]